MEIGLNETGTIGTALKDATGIDFSNYAFSSFRRRVARFIEINKIKELPSLLNSIRNNPEFAENMVREITVNVTEMFRDPSFWILLRSRVLPAISARKDFRIWHAACSTGEEVYSMAIMLREEGLLSRAQIVASDLNRKVLAAALRGEYNTKNQELNNKNYSAAGGRGSLSDYYSAVNGTVIFDSSLVSGVQFIHHDLTRESGPGKFDLILCRNVLIYFNAELQDKVIGSFSRSLDSGSFLAIGSKESLTWCKSCRHFEPLSTEENIYIKNREII